MQCGFRPTPALLSVAVVVVGANNGTQSTRPPPTMLLLYTPQCILLLDCNLRIISIERDNYKSIFGKPWKKEKFWSCSQSIDPPMNLEIPILNWNFSCFWQCVWHNQSHRSLPTANKPDPVFLKLFPGRVWVAQKIWVGSG